MDGARLSQFPHLSWLRFRVSGEGLPSPLVVNLQGACHTLSMTAAGCHDVRWITRGRERHWHEGVGATHFLPADDAEHTFLTATSPDFVSHVLLLPRGHVEHCLIAEGLEPSDGTRRLLVHDDATLQSCIARLFAAGTGPEESLDGLRDEAARSLVLRIAALTGGGRPDWHADTSVFEPRVMRHLIGIVDAHLRIAPSLADMGILVGLSPSHFARKFRQSTGLSLHRFVNRRRIHASMEVLRDHSRPLAHVALELGFSSQAHFTNIFSTLTGTTPARFRKLLGRTVG